MMADRVVREVGEYPVAELFIQRTCIEAEGIEEGPGAPTSHCSLLNGTHQSRRQPMSTQGSVDPEMRDTEPPPPGIPQCAAHYFTTFVPEEAVQWKQRVFGQSHCRRRMFGNPGTDCLDRLVGWVRVHY